MAQYNQVTFQLNEPLTRYFDVIESEPEPIPDPPPTQDCKLSLELEGFTLDSGGLIWDSQTVVKAELDNLTLEMAVICYETANAYRFWIRGEGMDTLEIELD